MRKSTSHVWFYEGFNPEFFPIGVLPCQGKGYEYGSEYTEETED